MSVDAYRCFVQGTRLVALWARGHLPVVALHTHHFVPDLLGLTRPQVDTNPSAPHPPCLTRRRPLAASYVDMELASLRRCVQVARRFRTSNQVVANIAAAAAAERARLLAAEAAGGAQQQQQSQQQRYQYQEQQGTATADTDGISSTSGAVSDAVPHGWGGGMDLSEWMEAQCYSQSREWRRLCVHETAWCLASGGRAGGCGRRNCTRGRGYSEPVCLVCPGRLHCQDIIPLTSPLPSLRPPSPPRLLPPSTPPPSPPLRAPDLLGWSAYDVFLSNYLAHFPPRQLLVLYASQLATQPAAAVAQLEAFLGVPPGNYSRLGAAAAVAAGTAAQGSSSMRDCLVSWGGAWI